LCTRVGIMASGRLRCLGSVQHLKGRFGVSYQVEIRCAASEMVEHCIHACLHEIARGSVLEERHGSYFLLHVPPSIELALLFQNLETRKAELSIWDYSVSQCSIEQIFIRFAKEQEVGMSS